MKADQQEKETFARAICRARVEKGLSLEGLAGLTGFKRMTLLGWEQGRLPTVYGRRPIKRLARALHLDEDYLLDLWIKDREELKGKHFDGRETFARAIFRARVRRGLSLKALAVLTGFDQHTHWLWESGTYLPRIEEHLPGSGRRKHPIKALAGVLDIDEGHLMDLYLEAKKRPNEAP